MIGIQRIKMSDISRCCTCGYEWKTGLNGSHSCSTYLQKVIDQKDKDIKELTDNLDEAADYIKNGELYEGCNREAVNKFKEIIKKYKENSDE